MKKSNTLYPVLWVLALASSVLLSIPWLVPHCGMLALVGFVPLLIAEHIASGAGVKRFWIWHYTTFVLWNAFTTFWICNATVGGGIFAVLANALQMSLLFGLFRLSKKRLDRILPYLFLAVTWIAWERWYLTSAEISWPWLVLGNAFATSVREIQWYSVTGTLGGSLWVWCANLGIFGMLLSLAGGRCQKWTAKARAAACTALTLVLIGPPVCSAVMYNSCSERSVGTVDILIGQPNLDPYKKFETMKQKDQDELLLRLLADSLKTGSADLLMAPETFTSDVILNNISGSATWRRFYGFLQAYPQTDFLFGASTNEIFFQKSAPGLLCYPYGDVWRVAHNSALMLAPDGRTEVFHKSKLVVGTESTPYPKVFVPLDKWLSGIFGVYALIARDVGQEEISLLHLSDGTPLGCAVCYESVYGEYCTDYVRKGAQFMTVITNDSWWGSTPGYRQHLSYSSLRAIELRRDIARCGNSGISCFINSRGDIVQQGPWWEEAVLRGTVNKSTYLSPFVRYGDIVGRVCVLAFLLLAVLMLVRILLRRK